MIDFSTKFFSSFIKVFLIPLFILSILSACTHKGSSGVGVQLTPSRAAILNVESKTNQKIALLLPLHGRYAGPAEAIKNGFLAAYDADKKQRIINTQVNIIDTSSQNVTMLYEKAVAQGANVVVGPLTKEDVQLIAQLPQHAIPTLALNTIDTVPVNKQQFYQFGLAPADEIHTVVQKAYKGGHRNALILTPNTPWGRTAGKAFNQQWHALGGNVSDQLYFSTSIEKLSSEIPNLLRVVESKSGHSKSQVQRRQDFDVILLATTPSNAKEVLSILKFNYVQNIPIYATSSIFSGNFVSDDKELDGIFFPDIPWLNPTQLSSSLGSIQQQTQSLWPESYKQYPRFYALGVDAYRLISNVPNAQYGATGYLTLDRGNKLHRNLSWFQILNGHPVSIAD